MQSLCDDIPTLHIGGLSRGNLQAAVSPSFGADILMPPTYICHINWAGLVGLPWQTGWMRMTCASTLDIYSWPIMAFYLVSGPPRRPLGHTTRAHALDELSAEWRVLKSFWMSSKIACAYHALRSRSTSTTHAGFSGWYLTVMTDALIHNVSRPLDNPAVTAGSTKIPCLPLALSRSTSNGWTSATPPALG